MTSPPPPLTEQITFLYVDDLERSHGFYHGALGLELVVDQGSCRIYRATGDAFVGVCRRPGRVSPGGMLFTLVSPEVDAWHGRLQALGVEVIQSPQRSDEYGVYHAFYRDPDGHTIEIQAFLDPEWASPV